MSDPVPAAAGTAQPAQAQVSQRPSRGRSVAVVICVVLAALLTTPAAVAYWGQRTLNDTQRYVETVGPLVNSPEVQDVIATKVTDAIQRQVDIEGLLNQVFAGVIDDRPRLQRLVGPLSAAINSFIDRQVREFLASDTFAELWTTINERAQQAFMRLLQGDHSGAIQLQGDQVVLDLSEVITKVQQRLVDRGLTIVQNVPIPDVDKQIVLMDAPKLKQARTIYAFANPVAQWLIILVGLLYLVALLFARNRARMTVIIGAAIAANALLMLLMLRVGRQLFVNNLSDTSFGTASRVFYNTLLAYLERGQKVIFWLGLILIVTGWFIGRNRSGTAVRTTVNGGLESIGGTLADGPVGGAGRWVAANALWLRLVALVLGVIVLFWGNEPSPSRLGWSLLLVLALLVVIQVLVGAGRRSASTTPVPPTQAVPGAA